jgi:hypothetical protein
MAMAALLATLRALPAHAQTLAEVPGPDHLDRSGISELVFWQAVNGSISGTMLGYALFADDIRKHCDDRPPEAERTPACSRAYGRAGGVNLLGLAAGISLPLLLTRGKPVPTSTAILINRSTMIGAMHGYIIPFAAGLKPFDPEDPSYELETSDARWLAGLTLAGDLAGLGTGALLSRRDPLPPGTLSFLGTLHMSVFFAGMTVGMSLPEDRDQDDMRVISAASLGLADVALAVALAYADRIDIGRNRVFWLDTGALLGALAGSAVGAIVSGNQSRPIAISSAIGMGAGMVLAYWGSEGTELWRRRVEPAPGVAIDLEAPALRLQPRADGADSGVSVALDLIKGRF